MAEKVITSSEWVALQDGFGHQMLREGKFTPGEIDMKWTPAIITAFRAWLKANAANVRLTPAELEKRISTL